MRPSADRCASSRRGHPPRAQTRESAQERQEGPPPPKRARRQAWQGQVLGRGPRDIASVGRSGGLGGATLGRWEGNLVIGSDLKSCPITPVERSKGLVLARKLEIYPAELVTARLAEMAKGIPRDPMRSIAWDQGAETVSRERFAEATDAKALFCDLCSPWQRGINESANGLIRNHCPKGTGYRNVTDEEVSEMQDQPNGRPRMTLGWKNRQTHSPSYWRRQRNNCVHRLKPPLDDLAEVKRANDLIERLLRIG